MKGNRTGRNTKAPEEGLSVDRHYQPADTPEKRAHIRLSIVDLRLLFDIERVPVKVAAAQKTYLGLLANISLGGLGLGLPEPLEVGLSLKIGCFIGTAKILAKGTVRHCRRTGKHYIIGIRFDTLSKESAEFIDTLYASKVLHKFK